MAVTLLLAVAGAFALAFLLRVGILLADLRFFLGYLAYRGGTAALSDLSLEIAETYASHPAHWRMVAEYARRWGLVTYDAVVPGKDDNSFVRLTERGKRWAAECDHYPDPPRGDGWS